MLKVDLLIILLSKFWRTLKCEDVYLKNYNTIKEAKDGISEYINDYNSKRLHSSIGYKTPNKVYNSWLKNCNVVKNNEKNKKISSIGLDKGGRFRYPYKD